MAEYTEAKKRANKKWNTQNRERVRYTNARSAARSFIKNRATTADLDELAELMDARRTLLQSESH
ncbi:hypothetical protein D1831_10755 [Lactiplantibacillus garii]|uniref:Uncharacterized protein n=1 Tax=Lactiplantibacillus garii TaxID=2306423 RepID=A0A3R8J5Y9_9LACO|nr:hypothetical protein [Lactiplantibacillus garii]RRK09781.1 hypothetical protein D1831_10755 [Lactiplantibacillus garii]